MSLTTLEAMVLFAASYSKSNKNNTPEQDDADFEKAWESLVDKGLVKPLCKEYEHHELNTWELTEQGKIMIDNIKIAI